MGTTVETVERYLEKDLVVHEALARGFLNIRRAARWLLETQGWDTTEEAVVSALRRYNPDSTVDLETALHILKDTKRGASTGLVIVSMPRSRDHMQVVSRIGQLTEPGERFTILTESERILLILEQRRAEDVGELLGPVGSFEVLKGVAEIELLFPDDGPASTTAMAVVINVLGHRGIEMHAVTGAPPTCSLFIPEVQLSRAYDHALWLTTEK